MEIIAFANQKGGVAKTTSTYNIAVLKAQEGKKVLMVDLDPQASLTILCGIEVGKSEYNTCNLFDGKSDPTDCCYQVKSTGLENLFIIPSDIDLAAMEQNITARLAREFILKNALLKLESYFDLILIDCPPQLGILTTNGLVAADKVVVPTKSEFLSYRGIKSLKITLKTLKETGINPNLEFLGFIITMFEKNVNDQKDLLAQFKKEGTILGIVKKSADTYKAVLEGIPVVLSHKKSDVTQGYLEVALKI